MSDWTRDAVRERLEEAAAVLRRLPSPRVQGYFNTWPQMLVEFGDLVGQEPPPLRLPPPSPQAISRMEATLPWLQWLEPDVAKLVWARAERTQWKAICWHFGISRATANRHYDYGLSVIAWRLNGRQPHLRRGRQFVVQGASW